MIRKSSIYLFESMSTLSFGLQCKQIRKTEPIQYMFNDVFKTLYSDDNTMEGFSNKVARKTRNSKTRGTQEIISQSQAMSHVSQKYEKKPTPPVDREFLLFLMKVALLMTKMSKDMGGDLDSKKEKIQGSLKHLLSDLNMANYIEEDFTNLSPDPETDAPDPENQSKPQNSNSRIPGSPQPDSEPDPQVIFIENLVKSEDPMAELEKLTADKNLTTVFQGWFKHIVKSLKDSQSTISGLDVYKDQIDD
jgi:hypothetical protein